MAGSEPAGRAAPDQRHLAGRPAAGQRPPGRSIQVADSTLVPGLGLLPDGEPLLARRPQHPGHRPGSVLSLNRVISGPVAADPSGTTRICDSIIDATSPYYVAYAGADLASAGADLHIEDSTVIGKVRARTIILASDTHLPCSSGPPRPLARRRLGQPPAGRLRPLLRAAVRLHHAAPLRVPAPRPPRRSPRWSPPSSRSATGSPAYALLSGDVPMAIWTGADNGSQLGVYLQIQETEAVSNVQLRAPEYLPALLESGIFLHPSHGTLNSRSQYPTRLRLPLAALRPAGGRPRNRRWADLARPAEGTAEDMS